MSNWTPELLAAKGFVMEGGKAVKAEAVQSAIPSISRELETKKPLRIRKKPEPNKTEAAWRDWSIRHSGDRPSLPERYSYEAMTLHLPSGTSYTPDWMFQESERIILVEVKGPHKHASHARSVHALKEAAATFPMLQFVYAQWDGSNWNEQYLNV